MLCGLDRINDDDDSHPVNCSCGVFWAVVGFSNGHSQSVPRTFRVNKLVVILLLFAKKGS